MLLHCLVNRWHLTRHRLLGLRLLLKMVIRHHRLDRRFINLTLDIFKALLKRGEEAWLLSW